MRAKTTQNYWSDKFTSIHVVQAPELIFKTEIVIIDIWNTSRLDIRPAYFCYQVVLTKSVQYSAISDLSICSLSDTVPSLTLSGFIDLSANQSVSLHLLIVSFPTSPYLSSTYAAITPHFFFSISYVFIPNFNLHKLFLCW